ncbi:DinB family protein [Meiothermus sp. CFH 77666]|nr:DinB family protein [Meiothermus sp. CFH 77666]
MLARYGDASSCLKHLERSRRELLHLVETLSDEQLFQRPSAEVWSPAEVLEHISLVEESAGKIIRRLRRVGLGEAEPFPPSPPGQTRPDGRPLAPPLMEPKGGLPRAALLERLQAVRERVLAEVAESGERLPHPPTYAHPFFGDLTALGWLQTLVYHEQHHLRQIQERLGA